MFPGLLAD